MKCNNNKYIGTSEASLRVELLESALPWPECEAEHRLLESCLQRVIPGVLDNGECSNAEILC